MADELEPISSNAFFPPSYASITDSRALGQGAQEGTDNGAKITPVALARKVANVRKREKRSYEKQDRIPLVKR